MEKYTHLHIPIYLSILKIYPLYIYPFFQDTGNIPICSIPIILKKWVYFKIFIYPKKNQWGGGSGNDYVIFFSVRHGLKKRKTAPQARFFLGGGVHSNQLFSNFFLLFLRQKFSLTHFYEIFRKSYQIFWIFEILRNHGGGRLSLRNITGWGPQWRLVFTPNQKCRSTPEKNAHPKLLTA